MSGGEEPSENVENRAKESNAESTCKKETPTNSGNTSSGSSSSSGMEGSKGRSPSFWLEQLQKTVCDIVSMLEVKT